MKETFIFIGRLLILPLFFILVFATARWVTCRPDSSVEKVAFPLAKAVVEHIEKRGVPKNLNEVKMLPYELECGKTNVRETNATDLYTKKSYVNYRETTQSCSFSNNQRHYGVSLRIGEAPRGEYDDIYIDIKIFFEKTSITYDISYENSKWVYGNYPDSKPTIISGKRTGICKPIRFVQ